MKSGGKLLACTLSSLLIGTGARAIVADSSNPYQGIADRNVFALKPPPPAPRPEDLIKKPDPPKIILTGITTILGNKRALMDVQMPAKPPEPAKKESFILTENERQGDIEVLEIDEVAGSVKVNDFGTVMTLTMEKDGAKLPAATAYAPPGGQPGVVPPPVAPNPYAPGAPTGISPGLKTIPTRTLRVPPTGGTGGTSAVTPGGAVNNSGVALQALGSSTTQAPVAPGQELTPAEHEVLTEANYEVAKMKGDPNAALYPPTRLNPLRNTDQASPSADQKATAPAAPNVVLPPIGRPVPPRSL